MIDIFESYESNVRTYCRSHPMIWKTARGAHATDVNGRVYIDFLSGAGALNYGHNHPYIKGALQSYLKEDNVLHSLDFYTVAKAEFIRTFQESILADRHDYKLQFTGPTGTNSVEAALRLARKITGRRSVVAFSNAFHGMSLGALATSASSFKRNVAGVPLDNVIRMPYQGFLKNDHDGKLSLNVIEQMLKSPGAGTEKAAAIILETIQGEGGLNAASKEWLQGIEAIARDIGALVIVDDIQAGCGRSGTYFSFEDSGIRPDLICLSKSLSGIGLPLSVVLVKPECDVWEPGEFNGTFRGNNLAFITGKAACEVWRSESFQKQFKQNLDTMSRKIFELAEYGREFTPVQVKGRGFLVGLDLETAEAAKTVAANAFANGLIVETCGPRKSVVKVMPPLNIEPSVLEEGLAILADSLHTLGRQQRSIQG